MANNDTRYGKSDAGGGTQNQGERKDEGWTSRQGGDQSAPDPQHGGAAANRESSAADRAHRQAPDDEDQSSADVQPPGTDQPPRMGGPLGPDPKHPHLPEGAQNPDTQGTGAGGFDRGVNATQIGAVHQGVKSEDPRSV